MTGQTDQTFPRAQVASRARSVQEAIKPFCVNGAALLAGSLRRRQERVKDAAIVAVPLWEANPTRRPVWQFAACQPPLRLLTASFRKPGPHLD